MVHPAIRDEFVDNLEQNNIYTDITLDASIIKDAHLRKIHNKTGADLVDEKLDKLLNAVGALPFENRRLSMRY